ncbi:alpha/beta hydrolase [Aporhodopirellula aestuarii]|uniref:Alpha/beta hydrolase n=1 Tax=Aporhodopirellula aestuarii TaxID=2950107 RepID=A0ABT0U0E1_9BACT|nr:alpha/beta hydrolase [Aporhodopirellula aestuarii]MCM2370104.1 alpha/beta hydrolase [Aporhodopirellula aestuarii]
MLRSVRLRRGRHFKTTLSGVVIINPRQFYRLLAVLTAFHCASYWIADATIFADDNLPPADAVVRVWPGNAPEWIEPEKSEQDTTGENGRSVAGHPVIRLGFVREVQLHVFSATAADGTPSPTTVVICPGGGFNILAWDLEGTEVARLFQAGGVNAAVLKYRVPIRGVDPKWRPAVQDIQRAVSLVRAGKVTNSVPEHVGVLGFSAGGNAAFHAATIGERLYKSVDTADASISPPDFAALIYPAWIVQDEHPDQFREDVEINAQTPPMFFAHAENDKHLVQNSVTPFLKLHAAGVPAALHVFTGSGHGFGARLDGRADDLWPELCLRWIRDNDWLSPTNTKTQ